MVVNYIEETVSNCVNSILKTDKNYANVCKCENCTDDIIAKVLNNLKPYYITTKTGEVFAEYSSLEPQYQAEVITEVIKAIEFVSRHPHHI